MFDRSYTTNQYRRGPCSDTVDDFFPARIGHLVSSNAFNIASTEQTFSGNAQQLELPFTGEYEVADHWVSGEVPILIQRVYSENCPYQRGGHIDRQYVVHKKFRFIEEFPDGLIFIGDSFGDLSYIDATEDRSCPGNCFCRAHDPASGAFTFVVKKSLTDLSVEFHDNLLLQVVNALSLDMPQAGYEGQSERPNCVDGFALLKSYDRLKACLRDLCSQCSTDPTILSVVTGMELLVNGLLSDGDAFKSFGYQQLYEDGLLSFELWKIFQQTQVQKDISTLDEGFNFATDDDETDFFKCPSSVFPATQLVDDKELNYFYNAYPLYDSYNDVLDSFDFKTTLSYGWLGRGCLLDYSDFQGFSDWSWKTPCTNSLRLAIASGNKRQVSELLRNENDLNQALEYAMESRHHDIALVVLNRLREVLEACSNFTLGITGSKTIGLGQDNLQKALELAIVLGQEAMVKLLVDRGGDLAKCYAERKHAGMRRDKTYHQLRQAFKQEHDLLSIMAQGLPLNISSLIIRHQDPREAWAAGIRTMRRFCNGNPPQGLKNIIAFLCISKAMSQTLDAEHFCDYERQFLEDLTRWQVVFTNPLELEAYRTLVKSTWGTVLEHNMPQRWNQCEFSTLTHFQDLLSTFIDRTRAEANEFDQKYNRGLETSQQSFRRRNSMLQIIPAPEHQLSHLGPSRVNASQPPVAAIPEPPDIHVVTKKDSFKDAIENNVESATLNPTVVILAAGAIFLIVIIFLQFLRSIASGSSMRPYDLDLLDKQKSCHILATYLSLKAEFAYPSSFSVQRSQTCVNEHTNFKNRQPGVGLDLPGSEGHLSSIPNEFTTSKPKEIISHGSETAEMAELESSTNTETSSSCARSISQSSTPRVTKPHSKPMLPCPTCRRQVQATNLRRHMRERHPTGNKAKFTCGICGDPFTRKEYQQKHERIYCRKRSQV